MRNYRLLPSQSAGRWRLETWVTGSALLNDPMLNRGTAFTPEERKEFGLTGLLPSAVTPLDEQVKRSYAQYQEIEDDLRKNVYLSALQDNNGVLFYRLLSIGDDHMPKAVYHAYGYVKKAAAIVNAEAGKLARDKADLISKVADEVIADKLGSEFPLYVWQTGSGTQSNMNVSEVISNRAIQLVGGRLGSKEPIHPNDDVNMSQSSNDTFVAAMHIATVLELTNHFIPAVEALSRAMWEKAVDWVDVVKIGRTHLQDATPLTVGQEWSGYVTQLKDALDLVKQSMNGLYKLAAGGTAVGTGLNTPPDFGPKIAAEIAHLTGHPFVSAPNKFAAQGSLDALVNTSAMLRALAVALIRWPMISVGSGVVPVQAFTN